MDVLVTATARTRFADLLAPHAPPVRWLELGDDGAVRADGVPVADPRPEVAWLSNDLFAGGPLRPCFDLVRDCPSLRWVHSGAAGVDASIFGDLLRRGVRLTTSHVTAIPIAEYVLSMVLAHYQRPGEWEEARRRRAWEQHPLREVHGTTWLVVGVGAIGAAVAVRASAFGAHVIGVRRRPAGDEPVHELVAPADLAGVVGRADVVVLATPGTDATHHLVDAAFLARMREGSMLVNVGRGSVVDEAALLAALARGVPEVAVLDVVGTEPPPEDHPFWDHPRVVLTLHGAGSGTGRFGRAGESFAGNLDRYLRGRPLQHEASVDDLPGTRPTTGWHTESRAR